MISIIEIPRMQQMMCEAKIVVRAHVTNLITRCYIDNLLSGHRGLCTVG